ncbi:MAG: methyltransferase domain-containing protein [Planctomycetota bacterium]|nr:methyltransferase domain-containing protein [Planctomycetota bacterium]MDA1213962.1 methyltransferase domain-containing protein [Planctomycetota bacterium]
MKSTPPDVPKQKIHRLMEFKGIRRLSLQQYRHRVRSLYDGPAGAMLAFGSFVSLHEPLIGHILKSRKFDVSRFRRILDVGSGAGQILGHMIKMTNPDVEVVACDLSWKMLKRAGERLKSSRPSFITADLTKMPFADESFDCITCGWVIEHLPDPVPGLAEIHRVLQPGGSVLILATEDTVPGVMTSHTWKCRTYSRKELRDACEQVGLYWNKPMWFTPFHRFLKIGGIIVEAVKPLAAVPDVVSSPADEAELAVQR